MTDDELKTIEAHDGIDAWRLGVADCIRIVKHRQSVMPDMQKPAYAAALSDLLIHFEAMYERGTARSVTVLEDGW